MIRRRCRAGSPRRGVGDARRRAEPEAPFAIEHREALIYMLCQAAKLEHGVMCQYLFAAVSLKARESTAPRWSADLIDPGRISMFERWESQAAVRRSAPSNKQGGAMLSASAAEYDIADVRPLFRRGRA